MGKAKKRLKFLLIGGIVLFIIGELIARFVVGLGDPPTYRSDENYEYIQVADQDLTRFGRHYITNEFSMRSLPLSDSDGIRILKIGDSVVNGGSLTDHDSLATTHLEKQLSQSMAQNVRVLNISSGSWGPDNAAAFIEKHGDFQADGMVLVFSSHDFNDNMAFKGIVGNNPSFPDSKPVLALWEGFTRYLLPRIYKPKGNNSNKIHGIDGNNKEVNSGWAYFAEMAKTKNIPILVVLHPTTREIKAGKFNEQGQQLLAHLDSLGLPVLNELEGDAKKKYYRDDIHYNDKGQRFLSNELLNPMQKMVQEILNPAPELDMLEVAKIDSIMK